MERSAAPEDQGVTRPLTARQVIELAARDEDDQPFDSVVLSPAWSPEAKLRAVLKGCPSAAWQAHDEIDGGMVAVAPSRVDRRDRVGLGIGRTRDDAVLAGIFDVVVRASRSAFERREPSSRIERPLVDPTDSSPLGHLVACAMASRLCVRVVQMQKFAGLPVAHSLVYEDHTRHLWFGSGVGNSLAEASERAISDALCARSKGTAVTRLRDGRGRWSNARSVHSVLDYVGRQPRLRSVPSETWGDDAGLLARFKSVLAATGTVLLSVDLDCPAVGLRAVRVIAPSLTDPVPRYGRPRVDDSYDMALASVADAE